jgi:hypothetical protein
MSSKSIRGYLNNNPLNIRISKTKPWKGEVRPSRDLEFAEFRSMAWGYRAAFKLLDNYRRLHDCRTLADFIERWAPPTENDTRAYIDFVAKRAEVDAEAILDTRDEMVMRKVVAAMSRMENGIEPNPDEIREGWVLLMEYL